MSKNIIIQEGGIGKQMTVSKLKTDKVGGGTCLWVPEDEVALGTKSISQNGTYKASDDGKYGFSQVTVNVAGGGGSADNSGQPISSGGDPDIGSSFIGIDPTDGEPYEYTVNSQGEVEKTPVPTVTPGGIGSSVIGKDTSGVISGVPGGDGNEYAIGIDHNGNIVATKVPSGIEIGNAPDKTSYGEGDTIDFSGIIVILKGGDGAMFSNQTYPNGRLPFNELIFPVSVAPELLSASGSIDGYTPSGTGWEYHGAVAPPLNFLPLGGSGTITISNGGYATEQGHDWTISYVNADALIASKRDVDSNVDITFIGDSGLTVAATSSTYDPNNPTFSITNTMHSYNSHKTWTLSNFNAAWTASQFPDACDENPRISAGGWGQMVAEDFLTLYYGNDSGNIHSGGTSEIPVQWKSPYDGRTFEDAFEITVTAQGSGYSDDSGGSSSGGGTSF